MPLVNISILKGKPPEYVKAIADGVNAAVIETMAFPDDDKNRARDHRSYRQRIPFTVTGGTR